MSRGGRRGLLRERLGFPPGPTALAAVGFGKGD